MSRLDLELVRRGLVPSRTRAAAAIRDGCVLVDGAAVTRAATPVLPTTELCVTDQDHYVSRAAHKLLAALAAWPVTVAGRHCLDVGASTGGFTQVLCERGAAEVVALDVGHGQLHPAVAALPAVVERSGLSIRDLTPTMLDHRPEVVVADLSFISLTLALGPVTAVLAPGADVVLLVKPQFELDRGALDRHGVVRSHADRARAVSRVVTAAQDAGLVLRGLLRSPVLGQAGNVEVVSWWGHAPREMMSTHGPAGGVDPTDLVWQVTTEPERVGARG